MPLNIITHTQTISLPFILANWLADSCEAVQWLLKLLLKVGLPYAVMGLCPEHGQEAVEKGLDPPRSMGPLKPQAAFRRTGTAHFPALGTSQERSSGAFLSILDTCAGSGRGRAWRQDGSAGDHPFSTQSQRTQHL